jgi:hypothetical protein
MGETSGLDISSASIVVHAGGQHTNNKSKSSSKKQTPVAEYIDGSVSIALILNNRKKGRKRIH